jgi:hypothetical protein
MLTGPVESNGILISAVNREGCGSKQWWPVKILFESLV